MPDHDDVELPLSEQLDKLPEPETVRKLRDDYHRTGTYSQEDLRAFFGDPARRVLVEPEERLSVANLIA